MLRVYILVLSRLPNMVVRKSEDQQGAWGLMLRAKLLAVHGKHHAKLGTLPDHEIPLNQ